MKAWAFEYLQAPLMPDHEVCLRAFSIPDSGNQSERFFLFFFFVSESRRSSRRMVFLNWMYVVKTVQPKCQVLHGHSLSNLNLTTAGYLLCCKTVVERYGWNRCRTACFVIMCSSCALFVPDTAQNLLSFLVYFEHDGLLAECLYKLSSLSTLRRFG